jgi:hypothetical protein
MIDVNIFFIERESYASIYYFENRKLDNLLCGRKNDRICIISLLMRKVSFRRKIRQETIYFVRSIGSAKIY